MEQNDFLINISTSLTHCRDLFPSAWFSLILFACVLIISIETFNRIRDFLLFFFFAFPFFGWYPTLILLTLCIPRSAFEYQCRGIVNVTAKDFRHLVGATATASRKYATLRAFGSSTEQFDWLTDRLKITESIYPVHNRWCLYTMNVLGVSKWVSLN